MDAMECISSRRSIRKFTNQPITKEIVKKIVQASSYEKKKKNTQTVRYCLILDAAKKREIAQNCVMDFKLNQNTIENAPALVVLSSVTMRSGYEKDGSFSTDKGMHWQSFDAGISAQTFCLAAHDLGLGTVIMGIFDEKKISEVISLPHDQQISALIAIGWPVESPNIPKRKTVDELLQIIE